MKAVLIIISLIISQLLFASPVDSLKQNVSSDNIQAFKYNTFFTSRERVIVDTTEDNFYEYTSSRQISDYAINLGYFGSPTYSLKEPALYSNAVYLPAITNQYYTTENSTFYNVKKPFTVLTYSQGAFSEQQAQFLHTQNYSKDLNVGLRLNYYQSNGYADFNIVGGKHISPWISYMGDLYSIHAVYNFNSIGNKETGGLENDSTINNVDTYTIALSQAQSQKRIQDGSIIQKWNIAKSRVLPDTLRITIPSYKYTIGHSLKYQKTQMDYYDKSVDVNFYPQIFRDSVSTYDTIRTKTISNSVFFEYDRLYKGNKQLFHFGFGQEYEYCNYFDNRNAFPKEYWNSLFYQAHMLFEYKNNGVLDFNLKSYLTGDKSQDIESSINYSSEFFTSSKLATQLQLYYSMSNKQELGVLREYQSNHSQWLGINQFKPVFNQEVGGKLALTKAHLDIQASLLQINNMYYFNTNWELQQLDGRSFLTQLEVRRNTKIWDIHIVNSILYQLSESKAFELPSLGTYNSLYYQSSLFHDLLQCKIGLEGLWYTNYSAPTYIPTLGVFANQDEIQLGETPIVNAFISLKYKPVRVLIKYNGLYSKIFEKKFLVQHYPQQTGYLAVAVSWIFYN